MVPLYIGSRWSHTYPHAIVLTHPLRALGFVARGSICVELASCKYIGLTCW